MQRVFLVLVMMALPMIAGAQGDLDAPLLTLDEALGRAFGPVPGPLPLAPSI